MSAADDLDTHPALIAARRAIAHAPDKLRQLESEALRLAPLIERGDIARDVLPIICSTCWRVTAIARRSASVTL